MERVTEKRIRPASSFQAANRLLRAESWAQGIARFDEAVSQGHAPDAEVRLMHVIARIRLGDTHAWSALTADLVLAARGRADLRRHLVGPFTKRDEHAKAIAVLRILVDARPDSGDDRRLLISLLGRQKLWDEAIVQADDWARLCPEEVEAHAIRIRLRLQSGRVAEAGSLAKGTVALAQRLPTQAHIWILALSRTGNHADASALALEVGPAFLLDERAAGAALHALNADDRISDALDFGDALIQRGVDGPYLRTELAHACLARGLATDGADSALEHLRMGLSVSPDDARLNALYGETLLRKGRAGDATPFLAKSVELAPDLEQGRAMYARALMHSGQSSEAADQWLSLVKQGRGSLQWHRHAVASLTRAGRTVEASTLFHSFIEQRSEALPATFSDGLNDLYNRLGSAHIPQARLDWAWSLRDGAGHTDRFAWEQAARWGNLADHLLLDWLECRDERADEAMSFLTDLGDTQHLLSSLISEGKGLVVATAHVGPLYAGPMVLDLLNIPSRWLASTSSMARTSYAASLISTSDQTEVHVAKASFRTLQLGQALCLAVDGAPSVTAPRIRFEGQEVTYSNFAARAAHRTGAPSLFCAPHWNNGHIGFTLALLPRPEEGEEVSCYAVRWRKAYLHHLRDFLRGEPENLRLSGGIWRHVKPQEKKPVTGPR